MMRLLLIGAGGFLGALARYALSGLVQQRTAGLFPLGTLAVNLLGCFVLGVLSALAEGWSALPANVRIFLTIGLLGSFTTFSTFSHETVALFEDGESARALWNIAANVGAGIAAVLLGRLLVHGLET